MDETEFEKLADQTLAAIEAAIEASGLEVDLELKEGGILEVEFEGGSKLIINKHRAAREIWVAAPSGGFHFRREGSGWRDGRNQTELFAALSDLVSTQAGRKVRLSA